MSGADPRRLPLGYWLRQADELLTRRIDEAQRANGLTRLEWQALNVIREGAATREAVAGALRPFTRGESLDGLVRALAQRGLIRDAGSDRCELTDDGAALYARALSLQQSIRQRAMTGISEGEYLTTVTVLRRLVENLERDEPPEPA